MSTYSGDRVIPQVATRNTLKSQHKQGAAFFFLFFFLLCLVKGTKNFCPGILQTWCFNFARHFDYHSSYVTKHSRVDQVKFVEDSL